MDISIVKNSQPLTNLPPGEDEIAVYAGYTCIGGRDEDQDALAVQIENGRHVFVVCDGMGGHAGGCVASMTAAKVLMTAMKRQPEVIPTKEAIITAVTEANKAVYDKAQEEPSLRGMGTTLVMLVFDSQAAYVTHIGDSRIYQLRRGRKFFRTFDHSMVFEQVARKKLTEEEARQHPRSNVLSKALGILPEVEPVVSKLSYNQGDRFILCCDGVWNCKPEPEIIKLFTDSEDLRILVDTTAKTVEQIGKEKGGRHDNHTMIAIDMKQKSEYHLSLFNKFMRLFKKDKNT